MTPIRVAAVHLRCRLCGHRVTMTLDTLKVDHPVILWWQAHKGPTIEAVDLDTNGRQRRHTNLHMRGPR